MFAFVGTRIHVTQGPYRYLYIPDGDTANSAITMEPVPLFDVPTLDVLSIEESGRLTRLPQAFAEPLADGGGPVAAESDEDAASGEFDFGSFESDTADPDDDGGIGNPALDEWGEKETGD